MDSWVWSCFWDFKEQVASTTDIGIPRFNKDFVLDTDASKHDLGAILSQCQEDNRLHPVAGDSQSISAAEVNYTITNLEILAVVWAITHFRYYLYGDNATA